MFKLGIPVFCTAVFLAGIMIDGASAETVQGGSAEGGSIYGAVLDRTHKIVSSSMYEPVAWFDNFFSDERIHDEELVTSSLRWLTALRWEESKLFYGRTSLHANVRLPKASKKLKLIISADDEDDPTDVLPDDPVEPGFQKREDKERANVGLRYNFFNTLASKFHVGTGIKFELPVDPYVRVRYRYTLSIRSTVQVRFTETARWRDSNGWKETSQVDFEKLFFKSLLFRWSNSAVFKDSARNFDWGSSFGLQHQLSSKNALAYDASISGVTQPDTQLVLYRIGVRFRRNFYREYLFFEIEPENAWPRNEYGKYDAKTAVTFRIEVQFGKS